MTSTENAAPVVGLRAARKEQQAMRKEMEAANERHPAGSKQTPKKAPAKAPAKAGKPAPKPAAKAPATPASAKLRWTLDEPRSEGNRAVPQTGTCGDAEYKIARDGEKWKVLLKQGGKTTTLATGVSYAASYRVAVDHARKAVAA
jgi:hypothetical protein